MNLRRILPVAVGAAVVTLELVERPRGFVDYFSTSGAALALAAVVPPAVYEYRRQQRGIEAKNQLMLALSITRTQLQQVRERIRQNTRHKI